MKNGVLVFISEHAKKDHIDNLMRMLIHYRFLSDADKKNRTKKIQITYRQKNYADSTIDSAVYLLAEIHKKQLTKTIGITASDDWGETANIASDLDALLKNEEYDMVACFVPEDALHQLPTLLTTERRYVDEIEGDISTPMEPGAFYIAGLFDGKKYPSIKLFGNKQKDPQKV